MNLKIRRTLLVLAASTLVVTSGICAADDAARPSTQGNPEERTMTKETATLTDLFDRWERVWHQGQYDLIPGCVGDEYIRHDEKGDRTVSRDAYAAEIVQARKERPNTRFVIYDHTFEGNRAWFRFTLKWNDAATGEPRTRAGVQIYRVADGKLVETWLMFEQPGSAWPDKVAQERWTSPSPLQ